jgi:hypothetical protein
MSSRPADRNWLWYFGIKQCKRFQFFADFLPQGVLGVTTWHLVNPLIVQTAARLGELFYQPGEFVCICTEFAIHAKKDGSQKAVPKGIGRTKTSADWIEILQREGCLNAGLAGAWIRLNPVTLSGSGTNGAHRDADVTGYRYLLVESDSIGFELQISLYAKLALPIAALITSGGQSVHAVVKVDAATEMDFRADAAFVLGRLAQFGIDPANGNPSRYGRMPGVQRSIGAVGDGQQRLLYFSPQPKGGSIF